jgi:beta-lactamase superfamily II metal-dependent hydrolase
MKRPKNPLLASKKSKKYIIYTIVVVILFAIACLNGQISLTQQPLPEGQIALSDAEFQVHVIDVEQADSILVIADGEAMLIDAAESKSAQTILDYLEAQDVQNLKYAVATHMHNDHIGGYAFVVKVNFLFGVISSYAGYVSVCFEIHSAVQFHQPA